MHLVFFFQLHNHSWMNHVHPWASLGEVCWVLKHITMFHFPKPNSFFFFFFAVPPLEPRWGRSCTGAWRNWTLTPSYWMQLSRVSLSARKTCSAWRGSAQKSQSPLGNCRLRCAKPAAVVNVKCSHFPIFWPLGGSIASGDRWCIVVSNIAVSFDVCDCCAMFRLNPLASLLCSPVWSLVEPDDHVFPSEILSFYLESARFEADKCSADRGGSCCFKVAFVHVVWLNVFCTIYL